MLITLRRRPVAGFTLIEVVLVLAIGGLIFLMAFLAFGQAQKNRRNTQQKRNMTTFAASITSWEGPGILPTVAQVNTLVSQQGDNFKDPTTGLTYEQKNTWVDFLAGDTHNFFYHFGYKCVGNNRSGSGQTNEFVLAYQNDGGSHVCLDFFK